MTSHTWRKLQALRHPQRHHACVCRVAHDGAAVSDHPPLDMDLETLSYPSLPYPFQGFPAEHAADIDTGGGMAYAWVSYGAGSETSAASQQLLTLHDE